MKNCTKSLLYRMVFVKRRGNTKAKVEHFEVLKSHILFYIKGTVEMKKIPLELIINGSYSFIGNE